MLAKSSDASKQFFFEEASFPLKKKKKAKIQILMAG